MKIGLALVLLLAGCASIDPHQFVGPHGKVAYSMKCSGFGRTLDDCYKAAGEICPSGYSFIDNSSDTVAFATNGKLVAGARRNMTIECN